MNVLDENVPESQRILLRSKRIAVRRIGREVGRAGMKDDEIIHLPHQLSRPTFFTLDAGFYDRGLSHADYCLVYLDVVETMVAKVVRSLLRHRAWSSKAKRMGHVIRASSGGMAYWGVQLEREQHLAWR